MELHQNLADDAHARLRALALKRQRIEILDDLLDRALEFAALHAPPQLALAFVHPKIEQGVRAAGHHLVGARAVQAHHQQVAVLQGGDGLIEHGGRDLEAGIHLAEVLEAQRDDRDMRKPHGLERLADQRDVVGRAAAAAGLRDEDGQLVGVVASRHDRFHDLARDQDGRIADIVVDVLEARIDRAVVDRGQQVDVVAEALEDGHQQLEVVRGHLRRQDGIAGVLHLLRELGARKLRARAGVALLEAFPHLRRRLLGKALRRLDGAGGGADRLGVGGARGRSLNSGFGLGQQLLDVQAARAAARSTLDLLGSVRLRLFIGLVGQRGKQAAHTNARGAEVGHLVDLEHRVHLAGGLQNLLHLIGGQGVQAAAEAVQLDEVKVATLGGNLGGGVETRVVHPLVDQADGALKRA